MENDELKEHTMNGLEIAHTVEGMTNEREKLSVDLADKHMSIKKLL